MDSGAMELHTLLGQWPCVIWLGHLSWTVPVRPQGAAFGAVGSSAGGKPGAYCAAIRDLVGKEGFTMAT